MTAGRIEILLDEYQGFINKTKNLEKQIRENDNEIKLLNTKLNNIKEAIDDLKNEGLHNRIFKWNKIIKELKNTLENA